MKSIKKRYFVWGISLIILLVWASIWPVYNHLKINVSFKETPWGGRTQLFYEQEGMPYSEENSIALDSSEVDAFNVGYDFEGKRNYRIDPSNQEQVYSISAISFVIDDTTVMLLGPKEIVEYFDIENATVSINEEQACVVVTPSNSDSFFAEKESAITNAILQESAHVRVEKYITRFAAIILFSVLLFFVLKNAESLMSYLSDGKEVLVPILVILVAGVCVWLISQHTEYCVHPDEDDVIKCVEYGATHWLPPDMRSDEVAGTYSGYGYTKLANRTYYFLIAGKIAAIAKSLWYGAKIYRVPNLVLFFVMAFMYVKRLKKKQYLSLVLGVCAQAWYIFSYTTADAFDFFLCFLVLLQLTDEDSLLMKVTRQKVTWKSVLQCIPLGVLFGFVFLGKEVYWAVLLLAFVVLILKLFQTEKAERKDRFLQYLIIVAFFGVTVFTRIGFDIAHYGFEKASVAAEMERQFAAPDKNPQEAFEQLAPTYHMFEQGKKLSEVFEVAPGWIRENAHSFVGLLQDNKTNPVYYVLMGILYLFLVLTMIFDCYFKDNDISNRIEFGIGLAIMGMSFGASILNSYIIDCQYQGRYLLPMLYVAGYLGYITPQSFERKGFKTALTVTQVLTALYFATSGLNCFSLGK